MKPWLLLFLMAASPGEGCDMAQKPVLYPGAVLSRNSQQRQAALQGGAYVPMDDTVARFPVTIDQYHCSLVNHPGTANKAYFARLKNPDMVDTTVEYLFSFVGIPGVSGTVGLALYEYSHVSPSVFKLTLIEGGFETRNGGSPVFEYRLGRPVKFSRDKAYVLGVVSTLVGASMTITAAATAAFSFSVGGVTGGTMVSYNDITETTGWPRTLTSDWTASAGNSDTTASSIAIFGGTFPVGRATGMGY